MTEPKTQLSIIIAAFNEEKGIGGVVSRAFEVLKDYDLEVLVVDDGSKDSTAEKARSAGATVVQHPYNKGHGASVRTGLRAAKHEVCATLDADGQHDPADLPKLLARLDNADMVVGQRVKARYSLVRAFGNWMLNGVASYLSGHEVPDLTSGIRVFRRSVLVHYSSIFPNRFSFPSTSTLALLSDGYSVLFEPFDVASRVEGSVSKLNPLKDGMRFLTIIFRMVHLFNPLRLYLPAGLFVFFGGCAWTVKTVIVNNEFSAGGIFLLLTGLLLVLMGFQIDQVSALRRQVGRDSV